MSVYTSKVTPTPGLKVSGVPEKFVFKEKYEKQKLQVEGRMSKTSE